MLQTCDCCNVWFQGRSHLKGWTRGGRYLCRYRWVRRAGWSDGPDPWSWGSCRSCHRFLCALNLSVSSCDLFPDLQYLADIRQQIPITAQRRDDLYTVTSVQEGSSWTLRPWEGSYEGTNTMQEVSTATQSEARDVIVFVVETRDAAWSDANSLMPTCFGHHNAASSLRMELWFSWCDLHIIHFTSFIT